MGKPFKEGASPSIVLSLGCIKKMPMKKERKEREPKPKKEKLAHPAYKQCVDIYDKWIKQVTGMAMQFDGGDGKGMNAIIKFIENSIKMREQIDVVDPDRVCKGWEFVLRNYEKWDMFHKKNIRLKQISANFMNIVNGLRMKPAGVNNITDSEQQLLKELLK